MSESNSAVLERPQPKTKKEIQEKFSKFDLLGEVVTWDTGEGKHHLYSVLQALKDADLPESSTKALEPRAAFGRAIRQMEKDEIVALCNDEKDILTFQFTGKDLKKDPSGVVEPEWVYHKECYVYLNKDTGRVSCKVPEIQDTVQKLLNEATVTKTGGDISSLVKKLFDNADIDMFPMRDRGSVYFVFATHKDFITKVDDFLRKLGGRINRLPVPTGDHPTVADIVSKQLQSVVDEHFEAIDKLTVQSANVSLEAIAARINESRTKVEAYASHLASRKEELESYLQEAQEKLASKVEELTNERKGLPPSELGQDKWGYKLGSDAAKLNAVITNEFKTGKVLMQEAGLEKERGGHLRELVTKGHVVKTPEGYKLKEETPVEG